MASKQLGKFRQWAGEVISNSKEKTGVSEELKELEKDVELRRDGLARLSVASSAYHHALAKKKYSDAFEERERLLPVDILGVVMLTHGEQLSTGYGDSLVKFGRAHCRIATLQESYVVTLKDTYISSFEKFEEDIKEYDGARKKLDSRRLTLDAAMAAVSKGKNPKKEKELEEARERYEEVENDVLDRIHSIQENEIDQMRELTAFLDLEMHFVEGWLDVLKDLKAEWSTSSSARPALPRRRTGSVNRKTKNIPSDDSSLDEKKPPIPRRTDSTPPRPTSRPSSRASRKRTDSTATANGSPPKDDPPLRERERSKRMSISMVGGWASSAVESVTSIGKKKDKFASLHQSDSDSERDEEGGYRPRSASRTSSISSRKSNGGSRRILSKRPPQEKEKRVVRAVHDFSGSADELSFKKGDEIVVLNEVIDGWWMGEHRFKKGKGGLFPSSYVEEFTPNDERSSEVEESEEDEVWRSKPLLHSHSPFYDGPPPNADEISITSVDDDILKPSLSNSNRSPMFHPNGSGSTNDVPMFHPNGSGSASDVSISSTTPAVGTTTPKKVPPPPPPRRLTTTLGTPPMIPQRPPSHRSQSSLSLRASMNTSYDDISPFDSVQDITGTACTQFKQNPFKPKGMCSNCFEYHT